MPRYIDADLFQTKINEFTEIVYDVKAISVSEVCDFQHNNPNDKASYILQGFLECVAILNQQPTADVKEVVYGEWIVKCEEINHNIEYDYYLKCSNCSHRMFLEKAPCKYSDDYMLTKDFKSCPKCSADMKKECNI